MGAVWRSATFSWSKQEADGSFSSDFGCQPCQNCAITTSETGEFDSTVPYTAYLKIIEHTCTSANYNVQITYDAFATFGNRFLVQANDVSVYDSGCIHGSATTSFTVPSGTKKLLVQVDGLCSGGTGIDQWSLTLACL